MVKLDTCIYHLSLRRANYTSLSQHLSANSLFFIFTFPGSIALSNQKTVLNPFRITSSILLPKIKVKKNKFKSFSFFNSYSKSCFQGQSILFKCFTCILNRRLIHKIKTFANALNPTVQQTNKKSPVKGLVKQL